MATNLLSWGLEGVVDYTPAERIIVKKARIKAIRRDKAYMIGIGLMDHYLAGAEIESEFDIGVDPHWERWDMWLDDLESEPEEMGWDDPYEYEPYDYGWGYSECSDYVW